MNKYSKQLIRTSAVMMVVFAYQLLYPTVASALTTGPSQPEVQSFEPVGTTDMVDLFSGDFVYNIPLLDVEGYPINISYHGGVTMEQESSWVGLGWNINPGVVNRSVRGLPDDFKGDSIMKQLKIADEKNLRFGVGLNVEPAGVGAPIVDLSANLGSNVNFSNYRGVSCDFSFGAGVNLFRCVSAGVNLGVGSQTGASIDYNAGLHMSSSQIVSGDISGDIGIGYSSGYNTRSGLKDRSFSINLSGKAAGFGAKGPNGSATVPIGLKNMVPVITNRSTMSTLYGQLRVGGEVFWVQASLSVNGMGSTLHYDSEGSRKGYGYLYASDAAGDDDILDFTRDRDGMFNKSMQYLPPGNMTYDIYNVTGQGTGGSFRPFRNDMGSVYDPVTESTQDGASANVEVGVGWNFSLGGDGTKTNTNIASGPWQKFKKPFQGSKPGSLYEDVYFKQAGELTKADPGYYSAIGGENPVSGNAINSIPLRKASAEQRREYRANHIAYFDGWEASQTGVGSQKMIYSYKSNNGFAGGPVAAKDSFVRYTDLNLEKKRHHISEVVQTQTDGRRYIYGIPAMNNIQKEVVFAVKAPTETDKAKGLVAYDKGVDDSRANSNGIDNYYSSTITPAFAHSYLLTSVLAENYTDLTGDGPTDDDLGSYTKFNYTCKNTDYRWRSPIENGKAQYNQGFVTDVKDDKGSYIIGSREQWMLHSVESKNYVAEFYTSPRQDGLGVMDSISIKGDGYYKQPYNQYLTDTGRSYKLDSIKLYNKHDRFINKTTAVPIKTVFFVYDYSLCPGIPNTSIPGSGKLTLRKIYFRHGNSDRSMLSPYRFEYADDSNPIPYFSDRKDRWGNYQPRNTSFNSFEFPYVDQNNTSNASAWSLSKIILPSGGDIEVNYEADDYAYVQNKIAMEMFPVEGIGSSRQFSAGNKLYFDKNSPNLYVYFKRRANAEKPGLSLKENYLKNQDCFYYNFSVKLVGDSYEPIKGYAGFEVEEVGECEDGEHGYIKMKPSELEHGDGALNPATYTGLNVGRYNLPHIFFPGGGNSLSAMLAGLRYSFTELLEIGKNPLLRMVQQGKAKDVNLSKSYIRLNSPGLKKKGGGQRVKSLLFHDNWDAMAGGNANEATYGKQYDYTMTDPGGTFGTISSGVASYEPSVGGDENPFRVPVTYQGQSGSKWPPNDPVVLYQETPIGESFFPTATVGYARVTVTSIHKEVGRSSQAIDINEFYTARDFPIQVKSAPLDIMQDSESYGFTSQSRSLEVSQGYTYIFNDMHGKPKRVEHRVHKPMGNTDELISYTLYKYNESGGRLNNTVDVMELVPGSSKLRKTTAQLGVESDVTIDARSKTEDTDNDQLYLNLNTSTVGIFPIPIPLPIPWTSGYHNNFKMAVATKIIQQYGILREVQSYQEGAVTTVRNEVFDPATGQAIVTSVNNEFRDKNYSVNFPAYWVQSGMGAASFNQGYTAHYASLPLRNHSFYGQLNHLTIENPSARVYTAGDEVLIRYKYNNNIRQLYGTVICAEYTAQSRILMLPKYGYPSNDIWPHTPQSVTDVDIKIIRSGFKNQLTSSSLAITSLDPFFDNSGYIVDSIRALSATENEYYSSVCIPSTSALTLNYLDGGDYNLIAHPAFQSLGQRVYMDNRKYSGLSSRDAGFFELKRILGSGFNAYMQKLASKDVTLLYGYENYTYGFGYNNGMTGPYSYLLRENTQQMVMGTGERWTSPSYVTKKSVWENEIESRDAIGNYSSALYGYSNSLPIAIGQNTRKFEMLFDGFEDYQLLQPPSIFSGFNFSPFRQAFGTSQLSGSQYRVHNLVGTNSVELQKAISHTGYYSLKLPASGTYYDFQILAQPSVIGNLNLASHAVDFPFCVERGKRYLMSYWIKAINPSANALAYPLPTQAAAGMTTSIVAKSNIIDGWQQIEAVINVPSTATVVDLKFPGGYYLDDVRLFPIAANVKSFVYNQWNQKLMATLDENNYATFYEYDQEGNLLRTKKETERGIITLTESRNANHAQ